MGQVSPVLLHIVVVVVLHVPLPQALSVLQVTPVLVHRLPQVKLLVHCVVLPAHVPGRQSPDLHPGLLVHVAPPSLAEEHVGIGDARSQNSLVWHWVVDWHSDPSGSCGWHVGAPVVELQKLPLAQPNCPQGSPVLALATQVWFGAQMLSLLAHSNVLKHWLPSGTRPTQALSMHAASHGTSVSTVAHESLGAMSASRQRFMVEESNLTRLAAIASSSWAIARWHLRVMSSWH